MEAIVEQKRTCTRRDMCLLRAQMVCGSCIGGVFKQLIHNRHSFDAHVSAGHTTTRGMFAWTRAIVEAIVKPTRTNILKVCACCGPRRCMSVGSCYHTIGGLVYISLNTPRLLVRRTHLVGGKQS